MVNRKCSFSWKHLQLSQFCGQCHCLITGSSCFPSNPALTTSVSRIRFTAGLIWCLLISTITANVLSAVSFTLGFGTRELWWGHCGQIVSTWDACLRTRLLEPHTWSFQKALNMHHFYVGGYGYLSCSPSKPLPCLAWEKVENPALLLMSFWRTQRWNALCREWHVMQWAALSIMLVKCWELSERDSCQDWTDAYRMLRLVSCVLQVARRYWLPFVF